MPYNKVITIGVNGSIKGRRLPGHEFHSYVVGLQIITKCCLYNYEQVAEKSWLGISPCLGGANQKKVDRSRQNKMRFMFRTK